MFPSKTKNIIQWNLSLVKSLKSPLGRSRNWSFCGLSDTFQEKYDSKLMEISDLGQVVDVGPVDVNVGYGFEMGYAMEYDTVGIYISNLLWLWYWDCFVLMVDTQILYILWINDDKLGISRHLIFQKHTTQQSSSLYIWCTYPIYPTWPTLEWL